MADLISQPNFAAQIAQAAAIPGNNANQWANVGQTQAQTALLGQQATAAGLQNTITRMTLPLIQSALQDAGQNQNYGFNTQLNSSNPLPGMGSSSPASNPNAAPIPTDQTSADRGTAGVNAQPAPIPGAPGVSGPGTAAAGAGASTASAPPTNPDHFIAGQQSTTDTWAEQKLRPLPTARPDSINRQILGLTLAGKKDAADALGARYDQAVAGENQRRMALTNQSIAAAQDIISADNNGLDVRSTLARVAPDAEKLLPPDATTAQIRALAEHTITSAFMYSGRGIKVLNDGTIVDETSDRPIPVLAKVGLSAEGISGLYSQANSMHERTKRDPKTGEEKTTLVPEWDYQGYDSANQMVYGITRNTADMQNGRSDSNGAPVPGGGNNTAPNAKGPGAGVIPPGKGGAGPNTAAAPPVSNALPGKTGGVVTPNTPTFDTPNAASGSVNLSSLPARPQFGVSGEGKQADPGALAKASEYAKAQQDMDTKVNAKFNPIQDSLTRDRMLLRILPNAAIGPGTETGSQIQTFLQEFGMNPRVGQFMQDPAARQILSKWLGTNAIIGLEREVGEGGSGNTRFSGLLSDIAMKQLSANADLSRSAIEQMLKFDTASNQYNFQKYGPDYKAYKAAGKDEVLFDTNYGQLVPQGPAINNYLKNMDNFGNIKGTVPQYKKVGNEQWEIHTDNNGRQAYVSPSDKTKYQMVGP